MSFLQGYLLLAIKKTASVVRPKSDGKITPVGIARTPTPFGLSQNGSPTAFIRQFDF